MFPFSFLFFFNDTATTEIYTLSLHDALPICPAFAVHEVGAAEGRSPEAAPGFCVHEVGAADWRSPEAAPSFC